MAGEIELRLVVGEVETGIWCDRCLLPSAITGHVYAQSLDGRRVGEVGLVTRCPDCQGWIVPAGEDNQPT